MQLVSVIIPCYNAEKYLSECIHSVMAQTYSHWELICINDGSTDKTAEILNALQASYPEKISVVNTINKGAPAARNTGLMLAKGELIQFLDADDIIHPEKFERQVAGFQGVVQMVLSDRVQKNHDLSVVLNEYSFSDIHINPLETAVMKIISTCNPLYTRASVVEAGGHNEALSAAQDWEFHIRYVLRGNSIRFVPGVLFINRKVSGSVSSNWKKVSIQMTHAILQLKPGLMESPLLSPAIRQYFARICMDSAIYTGDARESRLFTRELVFWSGGDYSFAGRLKERCIRFLGPAAFIKLYRVVKK